MAAPSSRGAPTATGPLPAAKSVTSTPSTTLPCLAQRDSTRPTCRVENTCHRPSTAQRRRRRHDQPCLKRMRQRPVDIASEIRTGSQNRTNPASPICCLRLSHAVGLMRRLWVGGSATVRLGVFGCVPDVCEILVDQPHCDGALAHCCSDSSGRSVAHVACRKDSRLTCLQEEPML